MPSQKKDVRKSIRFPLDLWERIEEEAESLPAVRRPGPSGMAGELVRQLVERQLNDEPPQEAPTEVLLAGRWYVGLPEEIQVKIAELGDALVMLYASRRGRDGAIRLANGTVRNTFVSADTHGTSSSPRKQSRRKR